MLFSTMFVIAATAFTSCVDDNEDNGMPYLKVEPETLIFDASGKADGLSYFTVESNREWELAISTDDSWVTPSAIKGPAGTTKVEISIPASQVGRAATLNFQLRNNYDAYLKVPVTVQQGVVLDEVYSETFGTGTTNTLVPAYTGWDTSGSGAADVTYTSPASGVDVRFNLSSAPGTLSTYDGSGGGNVMFGNGDTYFTVQNIALPTSVTGYTLSFGLSYYATPSVDIFNGFSVQFSKDGATWTSAVPFEFNGDFKTAVNWNLANIDFTLKEYSSKLYVKFLSTKPADGNYRIDDLKLVASAGGQVIDLNTGGSVFTVTPTDISLASAAASTGEITITSSGSWTASTTGAGFSIDKTSGSASDAITVTATAENTDSSEKTLGTVVVTNGTNPVTVTIKQKGKTSTNYILFETFEKSADDKVSSNTNFSSNTDAAVKNLFIMEGSGVTSSTGYAGTSTSIRTTGQPQSSSVSGVNNLWVALNGNFEINKLALASGQNQLSISAAVIPSQGQTKATDFTIELSGNDGATWVTVPFTLSAIEGEANYQLATSNVKITNSPALTEIAVRFKVGASTDSPAGVATRMDDIKILPGSGGTEVNLPTGGITTVTTIANAISGGAGKGLMIQGTVAGITGQSFVVTDATGSMYVYMGSSGIGGRAIGDVVKVTGETQSYGNIIQLSSISDVALVSSGSFTQPTATAMTGADVDTYVNGTAPLAIKYVTYTGTLTISGTYNNVAIDGTTVQGSIMYPTMDISSLNGQKVTVTGYSAGTPNSNKNFLNTVAVSVVAAGGSTPTITSVTPASKTWDATDVSAQAFTVAGTNLAGITTSSLTNFNVSVSGTTVTVTPKAANEGAADIKETLTITATGGNSKDVELTQSKPSTGGGGGTDDFATLANNSSYAASVTTTAGWVGANCAVQSGGATDSGNVFGSLMGPDTNVKAICINGKTTTVGSITSPVLTGGCGTLSFDYGVTFAETVAINFRVDIMQGASVVKTYNVQGDAVATKFEKYTFSQAVDVTGDFQIVITNLCPKASTGNADRYSIFNVAWSGKN